MLSLTSLKGIQVFSTAYIGSSNLSNPALTEGLEWNIKVTEQESFDIIKKMRSDI